MALSDGETESNLVCSVDGAGLECLVGVDAEGEVLGTFVGGCVVIRSSNLSRDKGFLVRRALAGQGSA